MQSSMLSPLEDSLFEAFRQLDAAIARLTDQHCSLKPEVALMIELYEGQLHNSCIHSDVAGQSSGLSRETSIRCIQYLEECGLINRSLCRNTDNLIRLRLSRQAFADMDRLFRGGE